MFAVHSCVLPPRNFRHAFNRPIHFDEWYSKFLGHGQLEKHPSFPYVVFIIHCAFMAGRRPPQRKSWVPSHQCIGSSNLSVICFTLGIFLSVFVNTIFLLNYLVPLIGKCQTSISLDWKPHFLLSNFQHDYFLSWLVTMGDLISILAKKKKSQCLCAPVLDCLPFSCPCSLELSMGVV